MTTYYNIVNMQPDEESSGGINDSVISGDIHHHHYAGQTMQQGMPQGMPQMVQSMPQTVIIDPNTGLPQNVIMIQQPSAGSKVVGILIIIYGVLSIGGEIIGIGDTLAFGGFFILMSIANIGISAGLIAGGIMMTNYQKRGVHLSLAMIVLSTLIGVIALTMMPAMFDDIADEEGLSDQERDDLDEFSGTIMGIGAIFLVICNGICGLIIAIPLMISNNGLDDSTLFG